MSLKPDKPDSMIRDKLLQNEAADKLVKSTLTPPKSWSKHPVPMLLGLLTAWLVGGAYLYRIFCCMSPATLSPLLINDGTTVVSSAPENLRFTNASAIPYISDNKIKSELEKAANYVKERPDKVLFITGKYNESELEKGDSSDLGLARAESLKKLFVGWGMDADYVITKSETSKLLFPVKDTIYGGASFAIKTIPNRFLKLSSGDFKSEAKNNLSFARNSSEIETPITDDVKKTAKEVAAFLKGNPNKSLQIFGWYDTEESTGDPDKNLGVERANALKKWWISMGVPATQIKLSAEGKDDLIFIGDKLFGGADYSISSPDDEVVKTEGDATPDEYDENGEKKPDGNATADNGGDADNNNSNDGGSAVSMPKLVNIYFDHNSDVPNINAAEGEKLAEYVQYLKAATNKTLTISGHTSSKGTKEYNLKLSQRRAEAVKNYLVQKGVSKSQIVTKPFGFAAATGKNDTEAKVLKTAVLN